MTDRLHANLEALSQMGATLADHGHALLDVQQSCHRDADGAQAGWVGSSAGTLARLLDRWAADSASHLARLGDHADGLKVAAVALLMMDQYAAGRLR